MQSPSFTGAFPIVVHNASCDKGCVYQDHEPAQTEGCRRRGKRTSTSTVTFQSSRMRLRRETSCVPLSTTPGCRNDDGCGAGNQPACVASVWDNNVAYDDRAFDALHVSVHGVHIFAPSRD